MGTKWTVSVNNSAFYTLRLVPTFMSFYNRYWFSWIHVVSVSPVILFKARSATVTVDALYKGNPKK